MLAKAVFSKIFDWVVDAINSSTRGSATDEAKFIGLLDVYGFESFVHNTYEQLCINFANEKLQQFFLKFIFKAEEDLYTFENVSWTRIEYQDNQGCIDLIEKSPTGIMRLLDETCKKPNSSDKRVCESVPPRTNATTSTWSRGLPDRSSTGQTKHSSCAISQATCVIKASCFARRTTTRFTRISQRKWAKLHSRSSRSALTHAAHRLRSSLHA